MLRSESLLIHARAIDEFLGGGGGGHDDDLTAAEFASWTERGCLSKTARTAINKQLAHLTTQRDERGRWEIHGLTSTVATTFLRWVAMLDADLTAELESPAQSARRILDQASDAWPPRLNLGWRWVDQEA